jgi:hypothetical protein
LNQVNFIAALPGLFLGVFLFCAILMNCRWLGNQRVRLPQRQVRRVEQRRELCVMRVGIDPGTPHRIDQPRNLLRRTARRADRLAARGQRLPARDDGGAAPAVLHRVAVAFGRAGAPRNIIVRSK